MYSDGQLKARANSPVYRLSFKVYVAIIRPFIGSLSLATRKETPSPLRIFSTRVYLAIIRALYFSFVLQSAKIFFVLCPQFHHKDMCRSGIVQ